MYYINKVNNTTGNMLTINVFVNVIFNKYLIINIISCSFLKYVFLPFYFIFKSI